VRQSLTALGSGKPLVRSSKSPQQWRVLFKMYHYPRRIRSEDLRKNSRRARLLSQGLSGPPRPELLSLCAYETRLPFMSAMLMIFKVVSEARPLGRASLEGSPCLRAGF
jgi:hypothetical protein